ncbi:MAG TPA: hypothetical protein VFZ61_21285, partial [Polyangiales bacterium]
TRLLGQALALLAAGGTLLACTNHARLSEHDLRRMLEQAAHEQARTNVRIELCGPPADHPALPDRPPHLKTAWVRTG